MWVPHDTRDQVVDFVNYWSERTGIYANKVIFWLGIGSSKFYDWKKRYGKLAFAFCSQKSVRNGPILGPGSCDFSYLADLPISEQVGTQDGAFTLTAT